MKQPQAEDCHHLPMESQDELTLEGIKRFKPMRMILFKIAPVNMTTFHPSFVD